VNSIGFKPDYLNPDWDPAVMEQHRALMIPDCFDEAQGRFIASIHTWVVRTRHHTILVDTCAGNDKARPGFPRFDHQNLPYLQRLAEAGVQPESVDFVLCTHLHADHCGWNTRLLNGRWVPTFPNAKYVFSRKEHEHWSGPAGREGFNAGVYADSVLPVVEAGQAMIVDSDAAVGDGLLLHPTPGHSPGHVAVRLQSDGAEGLFVNKRPTGTPLKLGLPHCTHAEKRRKGGVPGGADRDPASPPLLDGKSASCIRFRQGSRFGACSHATTRKRWWPRAAC